MSNKVKCKKCEQKFKLKGSQKPDCPDTCCPLKYGMSGDSYSFVEFKLPEPTIVSEIKTEEPYQHYTVWPNSTNPQSQFYWDENDPRHPYC